MKYLAALFLLAFVGPSVVSADESYPGTEYISGKAGFEKKIKGTLYLTDSDLRFDDKEGKTVFTIPLKTVKEVTNSVEQNPGNTGQKILFGAFASKKEEFLYVTTETPEAAEAVTFKCKNKTSPTMVAKIRFQTKKIAETPATPAAAAPADSSGKSAAADST